MEQNKPQVIPFNERKPEVTLELDSSRVVRIYVDGSDYPVYVFETRKKNALGEEIFNPEVTVSIDPKAKREGSITVPIDLMVELLKRCDINSQPPGSDQLQ